VADGATVQIYYESRISKLALNQAALPQIDEEFEEIPRVRRNGARRS
jgi:type I restriction enzyme R subunit